MQLVKGKITDTQPINQPSGSWRHALNVFWNKSGFIENENGFDYSLGLAVGEQVLGFIETPLKVILFIVHANYSKIISVDDSFNIITLLQITQSSNNDIYIRFNINYPIEGTYYYNYNGDLIITWTDNYNKPCILDVNNLPFSVSTGNIFNDTTAKLAYLYLFLEYLTNSSLYFVKGFEGSLTQGTYFVYYRLGYSPYEMTNWISLITPVTFYEDNGLIHIQYPTSTGKYLYFQIGIIYKNYNNELTAFSGEVQSAIYPNEVIFNLSNFSQLTANTVSEFTVPKAFYPKIGTITQLNQRLVAARLQMRTDYNYQSYALNITTGWTSTLPSDNPDLSLITSRKTFRHREVYAFYVAWLYKDGTIGRLFHIPGRAQVSGDEDTYTPLPALNNYQILDTCSGTGIGGNVGVMGYWRNGNEVYPNTSDFGGLANQPVRHHKMPSLKYMQSVYATAGNTNYGISQVDMLTVKFGNVVIPTDLAPYVIKPLFFYAQKDFNNSLVWGNQLFQFGAQHQNNDGLVWSTGGNWKLDNYGGDNNNQINSWSNYIRILNSETLINKPGLDNSGSTIYLSLQEYFLQATFNVVTDDSSGLPEARKYGKLDYTNTGTTFLTPYTQSASNFFRQLNTLYYVPANTKSGIYKNDCCNEALVATLTDQVTSLGLTIPQWRTITYEQTFLSTLYIAKDAVHLNFFDQQCVLAGESNYALGDCYVGELNTINIAPCDGNNTIYAVDDTKPYAATKVVKKFATESKLNLDCLTYDLLISQSTPHYKDSTRASLDNFLPLHPTIFNYSLAYNAINNLYATTIFKDNSTPFINNFPNRVARSIVQQDESKNLAWRTFLEVDYYELKKEKGQITKIIGLAKFLLIQTLYATYAATLKNVLQTNAANDAYLGEGDIFDREPDELIPSSLGYGGNQHQFGTCVTKHGIIWCDAAAGKIFLFGNQVEELSNKGNFKEIQTLLGLVASTNPFLNRLDGISIGFNEQTNTAIFKLANNVISYSFDISNGAWLSKHTYRPNVLFRTRQNLFAYTNETVDILRPVLFKFNSLLSKCLFDNFTYISSIIGRVIQVAELEVVFNIIPDFAKLWENINWKTRLQAIISNLYTVGTVIYDKTFTSIIVYNEGQCSGWIALQQQPEITKASIQTLDEPQTTSVIDGVTLTEDGKQDYINRVAPCYLPNPTIISNSEQLNRTTDGQWNFNGFPDMVLDIFKTFDITTANTDTNIANWITRTDRRIWTKPSPLREKEWYNIQDFISEFLLVRFSYNNNDQLKLEVINVGANAKVTPRAINQAQNSVESLQK